MDDIKNILVVSRMTRYCRKAIHYGVSLSKKYEARLCVVHVMHNLFGYEGWNLPIPSFEEEYRHLQKKAREELAAIIDAERTQILDIEELIREGEPTREILKIIKEKKIDLLVMQAHEAGRLEHFIFGHSNEALIRKMPCSILLVKKEKEERKF